MFTLVRVSDSNNAHKTKEKSHTRRCEEKQGGVKKGERDEKRHRETDRWCLRQIHGGFLRKERGQRLGSQERRMKGGRVGGEGKGRNVC